MKSSAFATKLKEFVHIIEVIIAVLVAVAVVIGLLDLVKYFKIIYISNPAKTYEVFNDMLGYALLLIVAIELIFMIIYHSTDAVLELVLYVIARKMLIYAQSMLDLVFGTLSIGIVFLVFRYLRVKNGKMDKIKRERDGIYPATTKIKDLLKKTGFDISTDRAITIGGLVSSLAEDEHKPIREGAEFTLGDIRIIIMKATDDGLIQEVMVRKDGIRVDYDKYYNDL